MGGDRRQRTTLPIRDKDLVALTQKSILEAPDDLEEDDPLADWVDAPQAVVATGSQPQALPTTSRTATLSDPLTTGLLAEVARRASTIELDPSTVEFAQQRDTQEIDPRILAEAIRSSEARTPVPENVIRKRPTTKK